MLASSQAMTRFQAPEATFSGMSPDIAAKLIAASADIALVIDADGRVIDLSFGSEDFEKEGYLAWRGQTWLETVTEESKSKVSEMMADAKADETPRWRQVNHPTVNGPDIPIRYSTVRMGSGGMIIALGRDLRSMAALQRRLVEAQQSMEREYARLRHEETRYRLLFQIASESVMIVDATTNKVMEANPAAVERLGGNSGAIVGRDLRDFFEADAYPAVQGMLAGLRNTGRALDVPARMRKQPESSNVSASLFRQGSTAYFLVRLSGPGANQNASRDLSETGAKLLKVVEGLPDGFVVTGPDMRVLAANTAFLDLAQMATENQLRGESLDRWMGRTGVDFSVMVANLREHGAIRHFATVVRGEFGSDEEVEVSAVSVPSGDEACFGFTVRGIARRMPMLTANDAALPRSVEQLTQLVGRVSLKELVRETTDMIERLCIEAALELTGDNRASAAEMLGLSRQSLYVKLRRYGLGDLDGDSD